MTLGCWVQLSCRNRRRLSSVWSLPEILARSVFGSFACTIGWVCTTGVVGRTAWLNPAELTSKEGEGISWCSACADEGLALENVEGIACCPDCLNEGVVVSLGAHFAAGVVFVEMSARVSITIIDRSSASSISFGISSKKSKQGKWVKASELMKNGFQSPQVTITDTRNLRRQVRIHWSQRKIPQRKHFKSDLFTATNCTTRHHVRRSQPRMIEEVCLSNRKGVLNV